MLKSCRKGMVAVLSALALAGCGGSGGGSGVVSPMLQSAVPGDGQVTLTWTNTPGIYYWLWWLQSDSGVTTIGQSGNALGSEVNVMSPYVMSSLVNGLPYSFALNAHVADPNSPGGPQSNSLAAIPRLAGSNWIPCTDSGSTCPTGTSAIYGITFGLDAAFLAGDNGFLRYYLAVGSGGKMFVSPDTRKWTALPDQSVCTPPAGGALRATDFGWGTYVAVGDNGTICFSGLPIIPQSQTQNPVGLYFALNPANANWYRATTLPPGFGTPNLYAVRTNAENSWASSIGEHIVVGSGGTLMWSIDGQNWQAPVGTPATTQDLYDVDFNYCFTPFWSWVAIGANGTIIATPDPTGTTSWTTAGIKVSTTQSLRGIACTPNSSPATVPGYPPVLFLPLWVVAGDGGVLLNSLDGMNWSTPANFKIDGVAVTTFPVGIHRVIYGTQFVAIGDAGAVFTSLDGASWVSQKTNAGNNALYAIGYPQSTLVPNGYRGSVPYGYAVGGANGFTAFGQ